MFNPKQTGQGSAVRPIYVNRFTPWIREHCGKAYFCSKGLGCQAAEVDLAVGTLVETGEHSAT